MDFSLSSVIEPIAQVENLIDKTQVSNTIENECSNSLGIDKEAHNVEINLPETRDSLDDSAFQNLPIKSTDKFPELNSCSNQRHLTSPTCSNEALASCDSENGVQVPGTSANCVTAATANPETATLHIAELLNNPGVTSSENIEGSLNLEDWPSADTQNGIIEDKNEEFCMTGDKPDDPRSQFIYEFELPQELCGRLIGKQGKHVKSIKDRSNANVYIKRHPFDPQLKIVVVEGSYTDVTEALGLIRRKYPLTRYPTVTLEKTNIPPTSILPETLQLHLPAAVSCDVICPVW
ncbi:hypothetical protein CEXT_522782 [Caerostris extrusa]|uniref:K Homology domain-containing protein n=1 Tax=Caerostris extrusa TaxID=172846 RepID=A0AAV4NED0_CAEEX|nr:hypothetical protein CEXT_522782 [Caerostris extrusa]